MDEKTYDFMTVTEVAKTLRVSKMTVYRLLEDNAIPSIRVGRAYRVPRKGVEEYIRDMIVE